MKKIILSCGLAIFLFFNASHAQEIPQSKVASLVINSFEKAFPKASDVEWEMQGELYKVEFEQGSPRIDHDAWYDKSGKLIKHQQKIAKNELPQSITTKLTSDFNGYRIDDCKKITEGNNTTYSLELKKFKEEWDMVFDSNGIVLSKVAD